MNILSAFYLLSFLFFLTITKNGNVFFFFHSKLNNKNTLTLILHGNKLEGPVRLELIFNAYESSCFLFVSLINILQCIVIVFKLHTCFQQIFSCDIYSSFETNLKEKKRHRMVLMTPRFFRCVPLDIREVDRKTIKNTIRKFLN